MKRIFISSFLILFFCSSAYCQLPEKQIVGVVTTFDSIPLMNVNIRIKSTKQVIQTDSLGRFHVFCNDKDKLKFTANGFFSEKLNIEDKTKFAAVNLRLKEGEEAKTHALGYATINNRDKLNSMASLNSKEMEFSRYANMYDLIRGKFAGVQIINGQVVIRGIKANSNSAALIVIDGITRNNSVLSALSPSLVKSINIIKDGSSSIYGMKGANGVVVIETKKGGDEL